MSIGWMGWPARPSALFGSLMVVSATAPTHFNAEQVRSSKETLWSQLIRNATYALILLWQILGTTPHAMAYLKLGIMYHAHLYIARSTLIFAEERTKFR
ncbi:MAG: hypothetical protein WA801_15850 [Pseudolabrys sp.]